jgi:hypothetical protein
LDKATPTNADGRKPPFVDQLVSLRAADTQHAGGVRNGYEQSSSVHKSLHLFTVNSEETLMPHPPTLQGRIGEPFSPNYFCDYRHLVAPFAKIRPQFPQSLVARREH